MQKRIGYRNIGQFKNKVDLNGKKLCLNCDKLITGKRRRYCSDNCYYLFITKNNHSWLRSKLIKERLGHCEGCYLIFEEPQLILDNKIPIALGGNEFDENNLQILCLKCNKDKTKADFSKIAKARRIERVLIPSQRKL